MIAYASAYLRCHYLAAFITSLLNNQPMGFYQPATLVKDAQLHGLKFKPIDITRSHWLCSIEHDGDQRKVRMGLTYVKGLRHSSGLAILKERARRPFSSIDDLKFRVPELNVMELRKLAQSGALNFISSESNAATPTQKYNRRSALWNAEKVARPAGPLFDGISDESLQSPLKTMTPLERLNADFARTGLTLGPHAMAYFRDQICELGAVAVADVGKLGNNSAVRVAGLVIVRQRPGTAKGFMFLSLEDETGILNIIINPDMVADHRTTLMENRFLIVDGIVQQMGEGVSVKANNVHPLPMRVSASTSHDFR